MDASYEQGQALVVRYQVLLLITINTNMLIRELFEDQTPVAPLNRPLPDKPTDKDLAQLGPEAEVVMAITSDPQTRTAMKALASKISRKERKRDSDTYRDAPYLQLVTSIRQQHPEFDDELRQISNNAMRKQAQQKQAQQQAQQQRPGSSTATIKPVGTVAPS